MSSCFLCDCSYEFGDGDYYSVKIPVGTDQVVRKLMKQVPIMIGSSGTETDDQQHDNSKKQNYVPYRVKRIEFCCSVVNYSNIPTTSSQEIPDYILIFKVPFRNPVFDYQFFLLESFMLYSEPESVLGYKVISTAAQHRSRGHTGMVKINIDKPFIVGPSDYVGVFYMFNPLPNLPNQLRRVDASAKVWFDVA